MAKVTGALLSFGASGSLGKTLVMSKWRGVPYARQHVVPTNPRTTAQQTVRKTFALLREAWKTAPAAVLDTWNSFAQGRPFLGVNKWVGENVRVLNGAADMANTIFSPGSKGGPAPASFIAETGAAAGEIDVTFTIPEVPNGWTLDSIVAAAFMNQDPADFFTGAFKAVSAAAPALTATIEGLEPGEEQVVGGWLVWLKPDGTKAYSVSIAMLATSGA